MSGTSLRVVARVKALPGKVEATRSILLALIEPTRQELGCITYELLQNKRDPTDFTFVEEWASDADLDLHSTSNHLAETVSKLADLLAEAPDIRKYSVVK